MHETAKGIIRQIIGAKLREIARTEEMRKTSIQDTHEAEGAMISRYDTFLEEAQYLAGGQNKRLLEARRVMNLLEELLQQDNEVSTQAFVGSLIKIENVDSGEQRRFLLIFDGAGGDTFPQSDPENSQILALSVSSPIGKSLLKRRVGEELECISLPGIWEVTEIQ